jgi:hypothetical protein
MQCLIIGYHLPRCLFRVTQRTICRLRDKIPASPQESETIWIRKIHMDDCLRLCSSVTYTEKSEKDENIKYKVCTFLYVYALSSYNSS